MRKSPKHGTQSKQRSRVISARKHIPHAPSVKAKQGERTLFTQSEGIFESLREGVIACDRDGKIARMNTSALKLFEVPSEVLYRGTDYHQFLQQYGSGEEQQPHFFPEPWFMMLALDEEATSCFHDQTIMLRMPSGRKVTVNISCSPALDAYKHAVETVYVFHDITHRYQKVLHLQRVYEAVSALTEAIAAFPAQVDFDSASPEGIFLLSPPVVFVAQRLVEVIHHVLRGLRVLLLAFEPPSGSLHYIAGSGLASEREQHFRKISEMSLWLSAFLDETALARLYAHQEVILTFDRLRGLHFLYPGDIDPENLLVIPLFLDQQLCGGLIIVKAGFDSAFLPEEVELVKVVATQADLVVECIRCLRERAETRTTALVLHEVQRLSTGFLILASHELKTPLTGILGNLQLAQRRLEALKRQVAEQSGPVNERIVHVQHPLAAATKSARLQERMIQDMIDDARIQTSQLELSLERCDLLVLLKEALARQQRSMPERTIVLEILPREQAVPIIADAERIKRVITTYVANAFSYSPADRPVTVRLAVEETVARISVQDAGPGISVEEQAHLWERSYRAKGSAVQHELDLSLGLSFYLCRAFIERHHGCVGVQSTPGHGTTFWFTLPIPSSAGA